MTDKSHLLRFGYAPGHYWFVCTDCDKQAVGDKRAARCYACAESLYAQVTSVEAVADKHGTAPMTIPEQAVQAACAAINERGKGNNVTTGDIYAMLEDAAPHLAAVQVQAGRAYVYTDYELPCDVRTPDGVTLRGMHLSSLMSSFELCKDWPAQDRILAALEPYAGRAAVLEEAALVAEARKPLYTELQARNACAEIASSIRSLIVKGGSDA